MTTLAIIPAKGGSAGVSDKNIRRLRGRPLIDWTLNATYESSLIDRAVVITDSQAIKERAWQWNAIVINEPPPLALPHVQVDSVAWYALLTTIADKDIEVRNLDTIVVLQPTSPFRTGAQIDEAIELFRTDRTSWSVGCEIGSVFSASSSRKFAYTNSGFGTAEPLLHDPKIRHGRQDYDTDDFVIMENGAIYVTTAGVFLRHKTFRVPPYIPYMMEDIPSHEIDTELDWEIAEMIVRKGLHESHEDNS